MSDDEQQHGHSSDNIARNFDNTNFDREQPLVTAMTTLFIRNPARDTAETLRKIDAMNNDIQHYKRQIQELDFAIAIQESYKLNIDHSDHLLHSSSAPNAALDPLDAVSLKDIQARETEILRQEEEIHALVQSLAMKKRDLTTRQHAKSPEPRLPAETPGPHRLQLRPERPADVAYRQQQEQQQAAENERTPQQASSTQDDILAVFKSLTKVLSDNNKQLHSNDVTDPLKFTGLDSHWDDWYLQWRTFLEAKGWLSTVEHASGPGTIGFDIEINKKIYNKLLSLCQKGTASTYVTKAANFNGWEAMKYLLERYEGFSKQRQRSLRQLIENLRHVHGTNMSRHIDKFERVCGQMAHNNPTKPPTEEQKIDWFLESVTERTYDSVHATSAPTNSLKVT